MDFYLYNIILYNSKHIALYIFQSITAYFCSMQSNADLRVIFQTTLQNIDLFFLGIHLSSEG